MSFFVLPISIGTVVTVMSGCFVLQKILTSCL